MGQRVTLDDGRCGDVVQVANVSTCSSLGVFFIGDVKIIGIFCFGIFVHGCIAGVCLGSTGICGIGSTVSLPGLDGIVVFGHNSLG